MTTNLPQIPRKPVDGELRTSNHERKTIMKEYADKNTTCTFSKRKYVQQSKLKIGDQVLINPAVKHAKLTTPFEPEPLVIVGKREREEQ